MPTSADRRARRAPGTGTLKLKLGLELGTILVFLECPSLPHATASTALASSPPGSIAATRELRARTRPGSTASRPIRARLPAEPDARLQRLSLILLLRKDQQIPFLIISQ
ncbi:hypothetical protein BDW72DRAFT_24301 [Aspergillus terricola var. indicus]